MKGSANGRAIVSGAAALFRSSERDLRIAGRCTGLAAVGARGGQSRIYAREGSPDIGGVGAIRRMGGYGLSVDEEILEARPPHYQRYTILRGAPVKNYCGEVHLEPAGGGTALLWTVRFTSTVPGLGPVLRIALGFLIGLVVKAMIKAAENDLRARHTQPEIPSE